MHDSPLGLTNTHDLVDRAAAVEEEVPVHAAGAEVAQAEHTGNLLVARECAAVV